MSICIHLLAAFFLLLQGPILGISSTEAKEKGNEGEDFFIVNTTYGAIRGFPTVVDRAEGQWPFRFQTFLGIPFAKPPLNQLRFEKPVEPKKWKGVRDTFETGPACFPYVQREMWVERSAHSEDCLHMNIVAPDWQSPDGRAFPVIVFIHGGGFQTGTIREMSVQALATKYAREGIVFVAFQYRIGPLGFAATGDEKFAGNYGLWDQVLALKFVRDNIAKFGGDPKRVTAWGFSAGSASVAALGISPHSRDLFRQAIQMSGSILAEWAVSNRPIFETEKMATEVGCRTLENSAELKKCLKGKSVYELMDAVERMGSSRADLNPQLFTPRLDADFFPDDPLHLLEDAPPKRTLAGVAEMEALTFTLLAPPKEAAKKEENEQDEKTPKAAKFEATQTIAIPQEKWASFGRKDFTQFMDGMVAPERAFGRAEATKVQKRIMDFYLDDQQDGDDNSVYYLGKYTELLTDIMFVVPVLQEARQKALAGWPVYLYKIDYFNRQYYPASVPVKGSYHAVELAATFDIRHVPFPIEEYSDEELAFHRVLLSALVNFVKNGDPSSSETLKKWPSLGTERPLQYALLNTKAQLKSALAPEKLQFWQQLLEDFSFDILRGVHKVTLRSKDEL